MLPSYLNLQHGPPRHPHQHCSDDEDGDEDDHTTFIYSDTQHDFPCHHCSNYSNRGHLCNIASKNNNEFMIDHDSSDDQNDSNDIVIKMIWMMTIFVLWCTSPIVLSSSSADIILSHSLTLPKSVLCPSRRERDIKSQYYYFSRLSSITINTIAAIINHVIVRVMLSSLEYVIPRSKLFIKMHT